MLDADLLPLAADRARLRPMRAEDAAAYAVGTADPAVRAAYLGAPEASA